MTQAASASGLAMPADAPMGFTQVFADDFTQAVPEGSFPAAVSGKWTAYPYGWHDTTGLGTYNPGIVSFHDSMMDIRLNVDSKGIVNVAAPVPLLSNKNANNGQLYGLYEMRFKADLVQGFKTAWLLWPDSESWPLDGEIDFPEGWLDGTIGAYTHHQNGTSGSDQDAFGTQVSYADWHTATLMWTPESVIYLLDGVQVGQSTSRIPSTPMHWVIQTETSEQPAPGATAHVYIDWLVAYSYTPVPAPAPVVVTPVPVPKPVPAPKPVPPHRHHR